MVAERVLAAVKSTEATVAFHVTGSGNLEVSAKAFAEELKDLADATQMLGSEAGTTEGHTYLLFQVSSFTVVHTKMDPKLEAVVMVRRLAQKEQSTALSQFASRSSVVVKFGAGAEEEPFADVKKSITDSINKLRSKTSAGQNPFADVKKSITDSINRLRSKTSAGEHPSAST